MFFLQATGLTQSAEDWGVREKEDEEVEEWEKKTKISEQMFSSSNIVMQSAIRKKIEKKKLLEFDEQINNFSTV